MGFETNIKVNRKHNAMQYDPLVQDLRSKYRTFTFINLAMSALGIYVVLSETILTMMKDLGQMCQTQSRGPTLARNVFIIGPRDHIRCAIELAFGLCFIF